ncbi:hypothetical protein [Streptomyces sp. NPDC006285]|uniref:hypothetical protein n=1 Tax=Streptomyces sp. NPDC006285 TaxID=3364742 RepID=UPI0036C33B56
MRGNWVRRSAGRTRGVCCAGLVTGRGRWAGVALSPGQRVYAGAGNPRTLEWADLAHQLFAGHGIGAAAPATLAVGIKEFRRIMARTRTLVLALVDFPAMPGPT